MGQIIQLDEQLSNMIAAGEVVEKISSIVKELVENSIDASANIIEIELVNSGLKKIEITDNGIGMDKEDALLSFKRHATSKIKNSHDLFRINSLGFRGEAIPSIASVSNFQLITSTDGISGYKVTYKGGKLIESELSSSRKGTNIIVNNVFYNTPARLKYIKSEKNELSNIVDFVSKMALSRNDISFTLINNEKVILKTSGKGNLLEVISSVNSVEIAKKMISFENKNNDFKIYGYSSSIYVNRANRNYITVIINGRVVKNTKVISSIIDSYKTLIPGGRYPIVVLFVEMDPLLVDVNIHPSKLTVKISEENTLYDLIVSTIKEAVSKEEQIPSYENISSFNIVSDVNYVQDSLELDNQNVEEIQNTDIYIVKNQNDDSNIKPNINSLKSIDIDDFDSLVKDKEDIFTDKVKERQRSIPKLEYIGQYCGTYLICQNEDGLFLIDQHAAAERIRYENVYEKLSNPHCGTYDLLIPVNLEYNQSEALKVSEKLEQVFDLGITLEASGYSSFYMRSVPEWFIKGYELEYAEDIIEHIINDKDISVGSIRDSLAKMISCKGSIKANKFIDTFEIYQLLDDLEHAENPYTCPHGRPSIIKFTNYDIEKMFKRVM